MDCVKFLKSKFNCTENYVVVFNITYLDFESNRIPEQLKLIACAIMCGILSFLQ